MTPGQIRLLQSAFLTVLVLHTFAAYAFCHLVYLQFRQYRLGKPVWGGWTWRALTLVFALNYLYFLSGYLAYIFSDGRTGDAPLLAQLAHVATRPLIGPLLLQLFFLTERRKLPGHWPWHAIIRVAWVVAVPVAVVRGVGEIPGPTYHWTEGTADRVLLGASDATAAVAVILTVVIVFLARRPDDSLFRRRLRRWYFALIGLGLANAAMGDSPWSESATEVLVMAFVLVTVYYGERLTFFDVFAKRGLLFLLAVAVLTGEIALIAPYLAFERLAFVKPWVTAFALIPIVLAAPWAYAGVSAWIDRACLGRRFSIAHAALHFGDSLQGATSEADLLERAEASLSYIFRSRACVDPGDRAGDGGRLRSSIRLNGADWGIVRVLDRPDEIPFLSEDAELLGILARALGSALEGQQLRDERLAQDQRERALVLSAAQSELKALRAQINPHFLFNALNTIAALIPRKPEQAEQTVERLADVFRYAVHRSDRERVRLDEEIEFVRAYLEIEQTQFGGRLRIEISVDRAVEDLRIPAMVVQTLAENAVKHGIAGIRGPGVIAISARLCGPRAVVSVRDNGPGFDTALTLDALPESSSGGYGLRNVQGRLRAYYGDDACLRFERDTATATTLVSIEVPVTAPFSEAV
jgi:two-component sensor histidine kinase